MKYTDNKQSAMAGSIVKRQLVLSSQRAKVFQISRRFSKLSNGSHNTSNSGSVPKSDVRGTINGGVFKVLVSNDNLL